MDIKVGDILCVKEDLNIYSDYLYGVTSEMEALAGTHVRVTRVENGVIKIDKDRGRWCWSRSMFEQDEEIIEESLDILYPQLNNK